MQVILFKETGFLSQLRKFNKDGGPAGRAAAKVLEIQENLERGIRPGGPVTNHGESRIPNCVKYDLGNGYRLVTVQLGEIAIFLEMGAHDYIQSWLDRNRNRRFAFNATSKEIRMVSVSEHEEHPVIPPTSRVTITNIPFLQRLENASWDQIISSRTLLRFFMSVDENTDDAEILESYEELRESKPKEGELVLAVISAYKEGRPRDAQAAWELYQGRLVVASTDKPLTEDIVRATSNSEHVLVLSDLSKEEMKSLLDPARFQDWMLFLHPGQKRVVDEDAEKPMLLSGVSGSGKTCVLVHRALRMAQLYPGETILVLTLNRSLARLIESLVERLCQGEMGTIKVMPFYDYLSGVLKYVGLEEYLTNMESLLGQREAVRKMMTESAGMDWTDLFTAHDLQVQHELWTAFMEENDEQRRSTVSRLMVYVYNQDQELNFSRYLREELMLVRSAFPIFEEYRGYTDSNYRRNGRAIQFQDKRRDDILDILKLWEEFQLRAKKLDDMSLTQAVLMALDEKGGIPDHLRARSVLVDEFQDFSTLDLQILRQIPTADVNGLFLTGDLAQKIFTKDLSLPKAGIGERERVYRRINKNYRNSRQILEAGQNLLDYYVGDTLARDEGITVLRPEFALRESARPFAMQCADPVAGAWQLVDEWLATGHVAFSVCIATASAEAFPVDAIKSQCPPHLEADALTGDYLLNPSKVVVSDIHNIKGFEFSLVVIVGLDQGQFPEKGVAQQELWRDALRLYVALTRGRDEVRMLYQNEPSPFIEAMGDKVTRGILPVLPRPPTQQVPAEDDTPSPETVAATPEAVETDPVSTTAGDKLSTEPTVVATSGENALSPEDELPPVETLNGFSIIPVRHPLNQRSIASALGKSMTQISLDLQEQGLFLRPDESVRKIFVKRIFLKYGAVPRVYEARRAQSSHQNKMACSRP